MIYNDCPICGEELTSDGYDGVKCFNFVGINSRSNYHYWVIGYGTQSIKQECFLIEPYFVERSFGKTIIHYNNPNKIILETKNIIPYDQLTIDKINKWALLV